MLKKITIVQVVILVLIGMAVMGYFQRSKSVQRGNVVPTFHNTSYTSKI